MIADSMAIFALSASRISPTMIVSGSARIIERRPEAKVTPIFSLTWTCLTPGRRYSTGSSIVTMVFSGMLICISAAYSVVDLPEPVGPVARTPPLERPSASSKRGRSWAVSPSSSRPSGTEPWSSTRSTTDSPLTSGSTTARRSMWRPSTFIPMRPSCGRRRSEMSRLPMIFSRETMAGAERAGTVVESVITPSTRIRTSRPPPSAGSKWMSEAPSSTACPMIELTSVMTGASAASSASSLASIWSAGSSGSSSTAPNRLRRAIRSWMSSRVATAGRTL